MLGLSFAREVTICLFNFHYATGRGDPWAMKDNSIYNGLA